MGKMTDIFQIVTPSTPTSVVQDNQLMDTGYAATSNYTWYQRLIQGSGTRLTRYNEYDVMDNDVEVARALDIIAEEMTGRNTKTSLPIELKILDEKHANTEDTIVLTLRTACHHWCKIHGFDANRLFKLSRNMVKYGDCFFRKSSNFKKWEWIPSGAIVGAIVDDRDVTNVLGYRVRTDTKSTGVANSTSSPFRNAADHGKFENVSIDNMVVFSINDDMSDAAPFGESVLRTVYKTHKQKELLEDAIVIYRIQRAPERRVFYIDVGKMPPHRVKSYLETIKNEIRQKKIPSNNMNGQSSVDSIYNPQSMMEDIFLAQRSDGVGSKVDVLQGGAQLGEQSDLDYFSDKVLCGLRIPKGWMGRHREDSGAVFNDGKLGAAYIEEQQFAKFVERLQVYVSAVLDYEFKLFLFESNIQIDNTIFEISLPKPSNYEKYKQADLDSALLGTIGTADSISWLSKRWIARNYLQMSEEQLIDNENLLKQEKGIDSKDKTLQSIYGPQAEGDMGGGFGGSMGGLGGDLGGFGGELGGGAEAAPFGSEGGEGELEGSVPAEQTAPLGGTAPGTATRP